MTNQRKTASSKGPEDQSKTEGDEKKASAGGSYIKVTLILAVVGAIFTFLQTYSDDDRTQLLNRLGLRPQWLFTEEAERTTAPRPVSSRTGQNVAAENVDVARPQITEEGSSAQAIRQPSIEMAALPAEAATIEAPQLSAVERLCPSPEIPDKPELANTFKAQLCGLVACAGDGGALNGDVLVIHDWHSLSISAMRQSCAFKDRTELSRVDPGAALPKVFEAISALPLPEGPRDRRRCLKLRGKIIDSVDQVGATMRSNRTPKASCGATDLSTAVAAFLSDNGVQP